MKIVNLDTNETADVETYRAGKFTLLPAILLYWSTANVGIETDDGTMVRGKATGDLILNYINEQLADKYDRKAKYDIRALIAKKSDRPFVTDNGQRVFKGLPAPKKGAKPEPDDYDGDCVEAC